MYLITAKDANGALSAGSRPKIHPTREQAMAEAQKLSQASVGTEYVVFGATDIVVTEAVYTAKVTPLLPKE